ncbi:conjugal transfer protein [Enterococcus sp.]|uniref:conjugal transfer protein n=1 Tax=Enterococcus sp. TaxID=35783 RepID=UPI00290B5E57|nr:conjugal transfer protein [Enterococcus sp.]MDU5335727.1 conjugal transfer protein [Enterococcus sp.]
MKKIKVKNIGLRKKTTTVLWVLLFGSFVFGVYKNFTAIDQHTVHEKKVIKTKMVDTNLISSYVEDFVQVFYSWKPEKESLEKRNAALQHFLPDDLQQLNQEMIRSDIPTTSTVKKVKIWKVDQLNQNDYSVVFSIIQEIDESKGDKKEQKEIDSAFSVKVRTDGYDRLSILSNPTMSSLPQKLEMKSNPVQDDMRVDQKTKEEILAFLNTFFKVYPSAKKTELLYYVNDKSIKEINKDYLFSDINQINYFHNKNGVKVKVVATYLDQSTKATMQYTYDLILKKTEEKWVIDSGI